MSHPAEVESQPARGEPRFQALIENVAEIVVVLDDDATFRYVSPSVERLLGYRPDDLLGRQVFELLDPSGYEAQAAFFDRVRAVPGGSDRARLILQDTAGRSHPFEIVLTNRRDDPGIGGLLVTAREISEWVAAEEALRQAEEWARAIALCGNDMVIVTDSEGTILYASPSAKAVLGWLPEELVGTSCFDLVTPADRERALFAFAGEIQAVDVPRTVVSCLHREGGTRRLHVEATDLRDNSAVGGIVVTAEDVSALADAEELLSEEAALLESIARRTDVADVLSGVSQLVERHVPRARASSGILDVDGVIRHRTAPSLPPEIVRLLDETQPDSELGRLLRIPGTREVIWEDIARDDRWLGGRDCVLAEGLASCWSLNVHDPGTGELLGCLVVFHPDARPPTVDERDLLDRCRHLAAIAINHARVEARLEHLALHDDLTGLPNRSLLLDRLEQAVVRANRHHTHVAVLFVDLDQFKVINDSLGHAAGDRLLEEVARRITGAVRAHDTVGRFGGDEFVVLCEDVDGETGAVEVAERIAAGLVAPVSLGDADVVITASVGIAVADEDRRPEALIRDADAAMYRAKESGRNRYAVADKGIHRRMVRRLELERALRAAIGTDALCLHYQPRVRLLDRAITGYEALVRWRQDDGSLLGAEAFIPVAEETGLIVPLGSWVLDEACRQLQAWQACRPDLPLDVLVNMSARQLADPRLVEGVAAILRDTGVPPERLCLEVTESALAADATGTVGVLLRLKDLGLRLAIDDFGTGYATLDYVRRFSMADELKIDRSFVAGLAHPHSPDAAIVSAAIVLADAVGFDTVAEGVETAEQLAVLERLGCQQAQGFYFGPPMPFGEVLAALQARPVA